MRSTSVRSRSSSLTRIIAFSFLSNQPPTIVCHRCLMCLLLLPIHLGLGSVSSNALQHTFVTPSASHPLLLLQSGSIWRQLGSTFLRRRNGIHSLGVFASVHINSLRVAFAFHPPSRVWETGKSISMCDPCNQPSLDSVKLSDAHHEKCTPQMRLVWHGVGVSSIFTLYQRLAGIRWSATLLH